MTHLWAMSEIIRTYGFEGMEGELSFYNRQAVTDLALYFYLDDDNSTAYGFTGYASAWLRVYDSTERNYQIKNFTSQLSRNSNAIVMNASVSDMTFNEPGKYYFELGFVRSGYDVVLRYGYFYSI